MFVNYDVVDPANRPNGQILSQPNDPRGFRSDPCGLAEQKNMKPLPLQPFISFTAPK